MNKTSHLTLKLTPAEKGALVRHLKKIRSSKHDVLNQSAWIRSAIEEKISRESAQ